MSLPVCCTTVTSLCPSMNFNYSVIWHFSISHSFSFSRSYIFNCFSLRKCPSSSLSITSVTWPLSAVPSWLWRSLTNRIESIKFYDILRFSSFILSSSSRCAFSLLTKFMLSVSSCPASMSNLSFIRVWTWRLLRTYE